LIVEPSRIIGRIRFSVPAGKSKFDPSELRRPVCVNRRGFASCASMKVLAKSSKNGPKAATRSKRQVTR